ncbi:Hypothetical predicted protein [Mytilus galloprovincialis]|uniref:Uncharacterized protein n=1 Tax=Mytilus galloprovincialis TaxID=29158 RepID=A0A8B6E7V5_MYTGA|nr:Hypothetical predicted protein [Mytilus galloprovincialis]
MFNNGKKPLKPGETPSNYHQEIQCKIESAFDNLDLFTKQPDNVVSFKVGHPPSTTYPAIQYNSVKTVNCTRANIPSTFAKRPAPITSRLQTPQHFSSLYPKLPISATASTTTPIASTVTASTSTIGSLTTVPVTTAAGTGAGAVSSTLTGQPTLPSSITPLRPSIVHRPSIPSAFAKRPAPTTNSLQTPQHFSSLYPTLPISTTTSTTSQISSTVTATTSTTVPVTTVAGPGAGAIAGPVTGPGAVAGSGSAATAHFQDIDMLKDCEREADMESEQQWTFTQKQLINDYRIYYQNMGLLVNEIDSNGPTGKMPKLPKKPKQRLSDVYGPKKVNKEEMTPQELHKYLTDNIADVNHTISRETFSHAYLLFGNESETNIVEKLNKGIRNLKRQDAQTLLIHISFGHFLNLTKAWLENERKEGRIKQSWSAWLKEKTGYSDDHARKLRALAKVLHEYHQFFNVGLPLNFILRKLKEIDIMLQIPELNAF